MKVSTEPDYNIIDKETYFLSYDNKRITTPSKFKFDELPYWDLSDKKFEQLCLRYAESQNGENACSLYGNRGQKQHGIDILVRVSEGNYTLYQCKNVRQFTGADLRKELNKFCCGPWFSKTSEYILISSNDLTERSFVEEFEKQKTLLAQKNISLRKCGAKDFDKLLRDKPAIVFEFFGEPWVRSFVNAAAAKQFFESLIPLPAKKNFEKVPDYISRTYRNLEKVTNYFGLINDNDSSMEEWIKECHERNVPVKTLIRSDAGLGKSNELQQVAYLYSSVVPDYYPVIIHVRHFTGNLGELIKPYFEPWRQVPKERLFMLIDGLDEVPQIFLDSFIAQFNLLLQELKLSNIIASVRSNFAFELVGEGIDADCRLRPQELLPLSEKSQFAYINKRLQKRKSKIRKFKKQCKATRVDDLLNNPFYLKNLLDIARNDEIPFPQDRADAINKIISLKMAQDKIKYPAMPPSTKYFLLGRRLAVFLTLTGKNAINANSLVHFTDLGISAIKYSSLFSVQAANGSDTVQFEHNNFQEYLSGDYLKGLPWMDLQKELFHEPAFEILKPRFINTANYLFTLLKSDSDTFQRFFDTLRNFNSHLLLKFEKDKIPLSIRIDIFKAILQQGNDEEISYLRGGSLDAKELVEFIDNVPEAMDFVLEGLAASETSFLQLKSFLLLLLRFEPEYIFGDIREKLHEILNDLITGDAVADIQDQAIDVMAHHGFFSDVDIEFVRKNCSLIDDPMVRGALLKMIGEAGAVQYFEYFLESTLVVFDADSNRTGYEFGFFNTIYKFLNPTNAITWLKFATENISLLSNILDHIFDYGQTLTTNLIYEKLAGFYIEGKDIGIYPYFSKLVLSVQKENANSKWGRMATFFEKTGTEQEFILEILTEDNDLLFRFQIVGDLMNRSMLDAIYVRFDEGKMTHQELRKVLSLLHFLHEEELYEYLKGIVQQKYPELFATKSDVPDWQAIEFTRQQRDFELLLDRNEFIKETRNIFELVEAIKDFDFEDGWFKLQWSDKKRVRELVNNTLVMYTIEQEKFAGTLDEFLNWFNQINWDWFRYRILHVYLIGQKRVLPEPLMLFFQEFVLRELLPKVDFRNPFQLNSEQKYISVPYAKPIRDYFMQGYIKLPKHSLLDLLSFDMSGFVMPEREVLGNEYLFQKIYDAIGDDEVFEQRIIANLRHGIEDGRIIETHCSAAMTYDYPEVIPILIEYIFKPNIAGYLKENIIRTIRALNDDPNLLLTAFLKLEEIVSDWQWAVFEPIYNRWLGLSAAERFQQFQIRQLLERSLQDPNLQVDSSLRWKLLKAALNFNSVMAADMIFSIIDQRKIWNDSSRIEAEDFNALSFYTPHELINKCFEFFIRTMRDEEYGENGAEILLKQIIKSNAIKSYSLMIFALEKYEQIIATNRVQYPFIVYLRWNKRIIISEYYQTAASFETEEKCLELVKSIN